LLHLVLDTNALGTDPPLNKLEHRILLDAHRSGTIALVVPQLTLREAVNVWRGELQSRLAKLDTAFDNVRKIAPELAGARRPSRHVDMDDHARSLLQQLTATLEAAAVAMPPSPEVAHDELIDLALARRQPFDKDGGGYRDALLWHIVAELAVAGHDVALVSGDKAAFAFNRSDSTRLAQPLLDDLARIGATAELYPTAHAAVEALGLVAHEAVAATAAIIARNGPDFPEAVRARLVEDLMGTADLGVVASLGNPFTVLHVSLGVSHEALDLKVSDARRTETGQLEATVQLAVRQFVTV
jgi:PIN domain